MVTTYAIWSEGYRATSEVGDATFHGEAKGTSFKDACENFFKKDPYFDAVRLTYWGCELFDNEEDARKSFG